MLLNASKLSLHYTIIHILFQTLQNQNEIIYIQRPIDKKKIVFYNDRTASLPVDDEFQKLWRSVAVDAMDDGKIDEYLEKQGNVLLSIFNFNFNFKTIVFF